jgi:hypothetical protein
MIDNRRIEQCARICDAMVLELAAQKIVTKNGTPSARANRQIDYAIRAVERVAQRIRVMKTIAAPDSAAADTDRLEEALAILREVHPALEATHGSAWKKTINARITAVLR